jgi:hypothetical protein
MQGFIACGWLGDTTPYIYVFTDVDEAMQFVAWAEAHTDDVDRWEIVTTTLRNAKDTYDRHRRWVEE